MSPTNAIGKKHEMQCLQQAEEDKVFWEVFDEFKDSSLVAKQIVQ